MPDSYSKQQRTNLMEEKEYRIKEFFNSLGFSTALLAGFSFTGILELSNWTPKGNIPAIREITIAFLVCSFVCFTLPLLLNMFFLNVKIDSEKKIKKFRKVRYLYTLILGAGIGGLEGGLCLYVWDNFKGIYEKILLGTILGSMVFALLIILWFKMGMDGTGGIHLEKDTPAENPESQQPKEDTASKVEEGKAPENSPS